MSPRSKGTSRAGHRKYRQKLDLEGAVIAGKTSLTEIVYCYRFPSKPGRVKIGYSSRGLTRVVEQSTAFPEKPEIIFVIHDRRAREIEGAFHEALASKQSDVLGTEWFDADWKDLLAVSKILRRATGAQARRVKLMFLVSCILATLGAAIYPMLALTPVSLANGATLAQILSGWGAYTTALLNADEALVRQAWEQAVSVPEQAGMPSWVRIAPVVLAGAPAVLPWIKWRRQAF